MGESDRGTGREKPRLGSPEYGMEGDSGGREGRRGGGGGLQQSHEWPHYVEGDMLRFVCTERKTKNESNSTWMSDK